MSPTIPEISPTLSLADRRATLMKAGRIIVVVVHDSGDFTGGLSSVLAPYGSTITYLGRRESYAMITQKGPKPSWFVEKRSAKGAGPTTVEAFIPPAGTLEDHEVDNDKDRDEL
ncbi:uncharacterized protein LOC118416899 [Branchiostoma floridae]|uniref:Uncharacterized protein LOC118416899 n=1 Tax=Branchiostoma floridae TaxID=7739 RepID=A0A9J7MRF7_BRAFL|nr:uncharacterized protein LOC118416899 [Branchiostoma floridae]